MAVSAEAAKLRIATMIRDKEVLFGKFSDKLTNKDKAEAIAQALLEYETLDGAQVEEIIRTGKMSNPPPKNIEPPVLPNPAEPLPVNPEPVKSKDDDGLLPGLQGAPAGA